MPKLRQSKTSDIVLVIPKWVGKLYIVLGVGLAPWIIYLAISLPAHHRTANWDVVWTGFDIGLLLALAGTAWAALTRSLYIVIAASASGTLLLVDAWFDLISEQGHSGFGEAVILALIAEIPLAFLSFYIASHALRHNAKPGLVKNHR